MSDKIWFKGSIIEKKDAFIHALSPTSQYGLNVFEGVRCYWNQEKNTLFAFRLNCHIKRLESSANLARISSSWSQDEICEFVKDIITVNKFSVDIAIRITLFIDDEGSWHSQNPSSLMIVPSPKPRTDLENIPRYRASISSWRRICDNTLPPRVKLGANYLNGRYAHLQAKKDGYDLPIFLGNDGKIAEGAGSCLFMILGKQLITPTPTSSILVSITRNTIKIIAREKGLDVVERSIDRTELYLADEVFLCGSAAEISPVVCIDGYTIGNGAVGQITSFLLKYYLSIVSGETADHSEWRTPTNYAL